MKKLKNIQISEYIQKQYLNFRIYSGIQKIYSNIFVPNKNNIRIQILNIRCLIFEYSNIQIYLCYTVNDITEVDKVDN